MDYNQFRIWVGRIFGIVLLFSAQNTFNYYATVIIFIGALIRFWATGYIHKDREVTMAGPYKLLRHPLYLGNFLEGLGLTLFVNVWQLSLLYIPLFFLVYYKKMKLEEQFLKSSPKSCVKLSAQYLMVLHLDIISRSIFPLFRLIYQ